MRTKSNTMENRNKRLMPLVIAACAFISACGGQENGGVRPQTPQMRAAPSTIKEFAQIRNNYQITKTGDSYQVTDIVGKEGSVTVAKDSVLKFTDVTVNLAILQTASEVQEHELNTIIELYIAFFNRVPDADGLQYWITQFKQGMSIQAIADSFYAAAIIYSDQTGYNKDMTEADFVRIVYKNVLGRYGQSAPPDADVQYWANNLIQKTATKASLVTSMLHSARSFKGVTQWNWVPQLLDNKVTVGKYFSVQQGLNYLSPQESISKGQAIVQAISSSTAASAISLINVNDLAFTANSKVTSKFTTEQLIDKTLRIGSTTLRFISNGTATIEDRNPNLRTVTWRVNNGILEITYTSPQNYEYPAGSLKLNGVPTTAAVQETSTGRVYQLLTGTIDQGEIKWGETGTVIWSDGINKGQSIDGASLRLTTTNRPFMAESIRDTRIRLPIDKETIDVGRVFAGGAINTSEALQVNAHSFFSESKSQFLFGEKRTSTWFINGNYLYISIDGAQNQSNRYSLQEQAADGTQTWLSEDLVTGDVKLMSGISYSLPTPKLSESLALHKWVNLNGIAFTDQPRADKTTASSNSSTKATWEINSDGMLVITKTKISTNTLSSTVIFHPIKQMNNRWWFIQQTNDAKGVMTSLKLISMTDQG